MAGLCIVVVCLFLAYVSGKDDVTLHTNNSKISPPPHSVLVYASNASDSLRNHNASVRKMKKDVRIAIFTKTHKKCRLSSSDPYINNRIEELLNMNVKLVEFNLEFPNYTENPLNVNNTWTFKATRWARAYSQHGQTLLSLAFNYGIMSLMTLTLGVENIEVPLIDDPEGCIWNLTENEKIAAVMYLLMRDFQTSDETITLQDEERICHEIVQRTTRNIGKFTDRCCHVSPVTKKLQCDTDIINIWLKLLLAAIISVKFGLLLFGPTLFISFVESIAKENFPYVVELKDPLIKTVYLCKSDTFIDKTFASVVDLRDKRGFPKLLNSIQNLPIGKPIKVQFKRYDILVNYKKLLVENEVPVGLLKSATDALCKCKIRHVGPFIKCCAADMFKSIGGHGYGIPWINCFKKMAKILIALFAPFPFYVRLFIFYYFEADEVSERLEHMRRQNMKPQYEGGILAFLTPTHWLFIGIYVTYFFTVVVVGFTARAERKKRLFNVIIRSFRDLKTLSYIDALRLLVSNIIWPFERFGIFGCLVAPMYWFLVLPFTILLYAFYCIPSIYVAFRMLWRVKPSPPHHHSTDRYKVIKEFDNSMRRFETEKLLVKLKDSDSRPTFSHESPKTCITKETIETLLLTILCIVTMFGILILMSEVVGFLVEIAVFTLMGIIVNAGAVLKYVTLLILIIVYSYDSYNNVGKKYLKLNKALFNEVKGLCKDIDVVTSMPSHLQENHGFKSEELSEQADYELPDRIAMDRKLHWMINDLVLFVDNEDMPRIPKKLFEEVCQICVAGAPGPVYRSLIDATKSFLKILVFIFFVFVVVLSFGSVYQVSTTNQMLAALAGGFLPLIMNTFMAPTVPDIEIGTVSFRSKLYEIIKNFKQKWPIYDFPFELMLEEGGTGLENSNIETIASTSCGDGEQPDQRAKSEAVQHLQHHFSLSVPQLSHSDQTLKPHHMTKSTVSFAGIDTPPDKLVPIITNPTDDESEFDVDILIYLPDPSKYSRENWLDEWSDLDSFDGFAVETEEIDCRQRRLSMVSANSQIHVDNIV